MEFAHDHPGFRLVIDSFEEFVQFVALIRGSMPEEAQLKSFTERLKTSAKTLADAVKADQAKGT